MNQPLDTRLSPIDDEIAAIREARHQISERFDHDPYRLVAHLMDEQKKHSDRLVRAPEEVLVL